MPNTIEIRDLYAPLTESDLAERGQALARTDQEAAQVELDIREHKKNAKSVLDALQDDYLAKRGVAAALAKAITERRERRAVECEWEIYPGGGSLPAAKYLVRIDTNEVVERALLSDADQQAGLFDRDEITEERAAEFEAALAVARAAEAPEKEDGGEPVYYYEEREVGDMGRIGLRFKAADKTVGSLDAVLLNIPEADPGGGPVNRADWEWETEGVDFDDVVVELEAEAEENIAGAVEEERLASPDITYERAVMPDPRSDASDAPDVHALLRFEGETLTGVAVTGSGFGRAKPQSLLYAVDIDIVGRAQQAWHDLRAGA